MAKTPPLPTGVTLYRDSDGSSEIWRVRLGARFLGKGRKAEKHAFQSHTHAIAWIKGRLKEIDAAQRGEEIEGLTTQEIAEAKVALKVLEGKASLVEAANAWKTHVGRMIGDPTVRQAIVALKEDRQDDNLSSRHVREVGAKLLRLFTGWDDRKLSSLTMEELKTRLKRKDAKGKAPSIQQIAKRVRYLKILGNFAANMRWADPVTSPLLKLKAPKIVPNRVVVLTPKEVARLLNSAYQQHPGFLAALAIKIFAGVRNPELFQLTWKDVDEDQIVLPAAFTKTNRLRAITVEKVLASWLKLTRKNDSELVLSTSPQVKDREAVWLEGLKTIRQTAGTTRWPQNALRHCFGSYHFALRKNENLTAAEAGNSPSVIKAYYLNVVKKADCDRFWSLYPEVVEAVAEGSDARGQVTPDEEPPEPEPESR